MHAAHRLPRIPRTTRVPPQGGATLVVALALLTILTLLALAGASTATTELVMAGNEQFRRNAALAAAAGIEQAIARLGEVPTTTRTAPARHEGDVGPSSMRARFFAETRFLGEETGLPQLSHDRFVGLHYVIESRGTSSRGASDRQRQGLFVIAAYQDTGSSSFGRLGSGLP